MHKIALLGFGTVGQGVYRILQERPRLQEHFSIGTILVRDMEKAVKNGAPKDLVTTDMDAVFSDPTIDIIVEVTGNIHPMTEKIQKALAEGKQVVTANKALVSHSFETLSRTAEEHGVHFLYEASVAGGVPVLKTLKDLTNTNHMTAIEGILNGTCNFILTEMGQKNESYADALKQAQALGFAEADPTADVSGQDTMRKLRILASLAYRGSVTEADIPMRGIDTLGPQDMQTLAGMGRTVKLLGQSTRDGERFTARVMPAALDSIDPRAQVEEAGNVVHLLADTVGWLQFMGPGAGMLPTANAVWADLMDIQENRQPFESPLGKRELINANDESKNRYYFRLDDVAMAEGLASVGIHAIEGTEASYVTDPVDWKTWNEKTAPLGDNIHWVLWVE